MNTEATEPAVLIKTFKKMDLKKIIKKNGRCGGALS